MGSAAQHYLRRFHLFLPLLLLLCVFQPSSSHFFLEKSYRLRVYFMPTTFARFYIFPHFPPPAFSAARVDGDGRQCFDIRAFLDEVRSSLAGHSCALFIYGAEAPGDARCRRRHFSPAALVARCHSRIASSIYWQPPIRA